MATRKKTSRKKTSRKKTSRKKTGRRPAKDRRTVRADLAHLEGMPERAHLAARTDIIR